MILSLIILVLYMSLVGRSKIEMEVLYQMGACDKPSPKDLFFIEPYYLVKGFIVDVYHYCWICISDSHCQETANVIANTVKEVKESGKDK